MTPAGFRRLKRRMLTKPTRIEFGLLPATSPRKQSRKTGRGEGSKRVTIVIETGGEKKVRFEKLGSAESAWQRDARGVSTGLPLSCLL